MGSRVREALAVIFSKTQLPATSPFMLWGRVAIHYCWAIYRKGHVLWLFEVTSYKVA